MKVLICVNNSLRFCPYANFYINLCQKEKIDFCVMYPDRARLRDNYNFEVIRYEWNEKENGVFQLLKYREFALQHIEHNHYDYILALTTGTAVLLAPALLKRNQKYLVDIRDYTREYNIIYYFIEKKVINRAECVVVSSPDFREFLPKREYIDIFNSSEIICTSDKVNNDVFPIRIVYVGTIAYPHQCEKLMNLVEQDERFLFDLYGNDLNGSKIENYIKTNKLTRSVYHGIYQSAEKASIIRKADILFNAYGNNSPLLKYALSNKLTDAAIYKKVVLTSPNTSMKSMLGDCSFAIDLDKETTLDELYMWYITLDVQKTQNYLNNLLTKIITTNNNTYSIVKDLLLSKN